MNLIPQHARTAVTLAVFALAQPTAAQLGRLQDWAEAALHAVASEHAGGLSRAGPSRSASRFAATPSKRCRRQRPRSLTGPRGAMAPSQTESEGSGTSSSGAKSWRIPRPSHARHMPCGLLKLKSCGLGGSKLNPQVVQA